MPKGEPTRRAMIWLLRYGAGTTWAELGRLFQISAERARQIVASMDRKIEASRRRSTGDMLDSPLMQRLVCAGAVSIEPGAARGAWGERWFEVEIPPM